MFSHPLATGARIRHEIQRDGTIKTVLHVSTLVPAAPDSELQQELVAAVVDYMNEHTIIDRADVD